MDYPSKYFLLLVLDMVVFAGTCCASDGAAASGAPREGHRTLYSTVHVQINNFIRNGKTLTVHCRSKDDDLGIQKIPFKSNWGFKFKPNFWGSTLFFCSFDWPGGPTKRFDIYDESKDDRIGDKNACGSICSWNIQPGGPCRFSRETKAFTLCYPWN